MTPTSIQPFEVFISYATEDKPSADAACAVLESNQIRCWIAPRDVLPGSMWRAVIAQQIPGCKILVLIFSSHANSSEVVNQEVGLAIEKGLVVIPFRIQNALPVGEMRLSLQGKHWLDAFTPPLQQKLERLSESVKRFLGKQCDLPREPECLQVDFNVSRRSVLVSVAIAAVAIFVVVYINACDNTAPYGTYTPSLPASSSTPPSIVETASEGKANNRVYVIGTAKVACYEYPYLSEDPTHFIEPGALGTVSEISNKYNRCKVIWDNPKYRESWIPRDDVKSEAVASKQ